MTNREIVKKLWDLSTVLMHDGVSYNQYVTELTYLLFLKMMKEQSAEEVIPKEYRWDELVGKEGTTLKTFYQKLLVELGNSDNAQLRLIYRDAGTSIRMPKNLEKVIKSIDALDWYNAKEEGLGNLYEGLLEKNANSTKSGAGQYFTPRPLIDVIVELIDPKVGEKCADPAAGTFGFMIAADRHIKAKTDNHFNLSTEQIEFQKREAFSGMELVEDTHRLALMNALLHDIEGRLENGDTLSSNGKWMKNFDVILTNPPFGTKKGGEGATRDDLTFMTPSKQLNFLQLIYNGLKNDENARAAVVVPDGVLFGDTVGGTEIRRDLMNKCNLHTILRLPTGIFYAPGVKTNVLFFNKGKSDKNSTKNVWVYDLRTDIKPFGKRNQLTVAHFEGFMRAYLSSDRSKFKDERWSMFTREQILNRNDELDIGLIKRDTLPFMENLLDPIELAEETVSNLQQAMILLNEVIEELRVAENYEVTK